MTPAQKAFMAGFKNGLNWQDSHDKCPFERGTTILKAKDQARKEFPDV